MDLDTELGHARNLDVLEPAGTIESIGLERTRYGTCYKGYEGDDGPGPHTVTAFPGEVCASQEAGGDDSKGESGTPIEWRGVA